MAKPLSIEFLVFMHEGATRGFPSREYPQTYTPKRGEPFQPPPPNSFDGNRLFPFGIGDKFWGYFSLQKGNEQGNRLYPITVTCYPHGDLKPEELAEFEQKSLLFFRKCACQTYDTGGKPLFPADKKGI